MRRVLVLMALGWAARGWFDATRAYIDAQDYQ